MIKTTKIWAAIVPAFLVLGMSSASAHHDIVPRAPVHEGRIAMWSQDCMKHHSTNPRELSECQAKVGQNRYLEIPAGVVTLDPGNSGFMPFQGDRLSFDRIGKGGANDLD